MLTVITPATVTRLASLGQLANELPDVAEADQGALLDQASALIALACRRVLGTETVVETIRLNANSLAWREPRFVPSDRPLSLLRWPIRSIASVVEDGVTLDPALYEAEVETGRLYRLYADERVPWLARKIVVTYTAGYDLPNEPVLARACLALCTTIQLNKGRDTTVRSERVDGVGSITYGAASPAADATYVGLPPDVMGMLSSYRAVSVS